MSARYRYWVWLSALTVVALFAVDARAAIDELELIVDGGVSTFPTPTAYGTAAQTAGQYWELTAALANESGGITYPELPIGDTWSITGEFWTGGGTGADAFYVYGWAASDPAAEDSANQQYTVAYDEWTDEIQLLYDGATLAVVGELGMDSSSWRTFRVDCAAGVFDIYLDSILKLSYDDGLFFYGRTAGDRFGFGARTGPSETDTHRVRSMVWNVTTSANTSALAVSTEGGAAAGRGRPQRAIRAQSPRACR